jgi:hypothetical protein
MAVAIPPALFAALYLLLAGSLNVDESSPQWALACW